MGCRSSICAEKEFIMTQELKKEEASTNFVLTEIRDQFSKIKILSSKLNLSQDSLSYIFTWLNELKY